MTIKEIETYIFQNFEHVSLTEANGDLFFMYDKNDKQPFATIVTRDNEYDSTSDLNREGFFRLNIGLDKETFNSMFGGMTDDKGFEAYMNLGIDFTKEDVILPHPTYGAMYWICVVNPSGNTFESLKRYLELSFNKISKKSQQISS
jgi:hypothetical protein